MLEKPSNLPSLEHGRGDLLSATRKEMYEALGLFHLHVRQLVSLMFAVLTAVVAVFGLMSKEGTAQILSGAEVRALGGTVLILLGPLGYISAKIVLRYYRLYVAALIFAEEMHRSVGLPTHAWFKELAQERSALGNKATTEALLEKRTAGWSHSGRLYVLLLWIVAATGSGLGGWLLLTAY